MSERIPIEEQQEAFKNYVASYLHPLRDELKVIEDEQAKLRDEIAELEVRASLIRKVLRPVFEQPKQVKRPKAKANGSRTGPGRETIAQVLGAARTLGQGGAEFTTSHLAKQTGLHKTGVQRAAVELRDDGLIRLSSVRVADGQRAGRKAQHYRLTDADLDFDPAREIA